MNNDSLTSNFQMRKGLKMDNTDKILEEILAILKKNKISYGECLNIAKQIEYEGRQNCKFNA